MDIGPGIVAFCNDVMLSQVYMCTLGYCSLILGDRGLAGVIFGHGSTA